ncbi:RNA polymerase sigma-70 factor [Sediminibacterium soli]|uniref:RNA polymerase sigma-70 factor n=1 Tax=Sediminibacterium soli TaxID=2698829 RepID=UPI00137AB0DB|nr:RNA polymerase sigma-70 factor [Sediminibacterium soli]NCI48137.1 RNA polymerase sigma-70 factor [Sediminibacterium soli]
MDYRLLDDEILVKLLRAEDKAAFKEIYNRHWKKVFESAYYRLGSTDMAKELVQNLFLYIWEKRSTLAIANLPSYLQAAIKNRVINHVEKELVQKKYQQRVLDIQGHQHTDMEAGLDYHELDRAFRKAVLQLPPKTRSVFEMSRFEHLPIKEIAARLGISEKAVEYHITSSLKILRISLKDFMIPCFVAGAISYLLSA